MDPQLILGSVGCREGPVSAAHAFQPVIHHAHRGSLAHCLRAPAVCACWRKARPSALCSCSATTTTTRQSDSRLPARWHTVTNTLTSGCCEGKTAHLWRRAPLHANSGRRFRGDACALSSCSWPHEPFSFVLPRPRRRRSSRACVCPGDGGAEPTDGDGGHLVESSLRMSAILAERKARFRHLHEHCCPQTSTSPPALHP